MAGEATPQRPGVRMLLLILVLSCLVPGAIGVGALAYRLVQQSLEQTESSTILTAHALVQALDGQLRSAQNFAAGLASSDHLAQGDLATFHERSRALLKVTGVGSRMALTDASGRHVLNTLRDLGETLPPEGNADQLRRVFSTGLPSVSNSFTAGLTGEPAISFDAPVKLKGEVVYVVSLVMDRRDFDDLLKRQNMPMDWVSSISDRAGATVARSALPERFVGKVNPELLRHVQNAPEGAYATDTREGIPAVIAYSRSPNTGWTVAIAIPKQSLMARWQGDLLRLGSGVLVLFALGTVLAWRQGGKIATSVQGLKDATVAMAQGHTAPACEMHFAEAQQASQAIGQSLQLLAERAAAAAASNDETRASKAKLDAALASMTDAVVISDAEGRFIDFNEAFASFHRFASKQDCLKTFAEYPDILEACLASGELAEVSQWAVPRALRGETAASVEYKLRRKDTGETWFGSYSFAPIRAADGSIVGSVVSARDITARKRTEGELRQREELLSTLTDRARVGMVMVDIHRSYVFANAAYAEILGLESSAIVGKRIAEVLPAVFDSQIRPRLELAFAGNAVTYELTMPRRRGLDGDRVFAVSYDPPVSTMHGPCVIVVIVDVTDRVRAQAESQAMFETMSDALIFADAQRCIRRVNPAFVSIFGYSAEEVIGRTTEFLYADPDDYASQGRLRFQPDPVVTGAPYELRYRRKDGSEIWTESIGRSLVGSDGTVVGGFALHRDITAQKRARLDLEQHRVQAEAALRRRDLRLTGLIESAMDAVVSINERHEIVLFNAAAEKMFGYTAAAVLGQRLGLLIPPRHHADHDAHIEAFQHAGVTARRMGLLGHVAGLRADGTEFPVEASISQLRHGSETTFTVILRDVTERAQAEQARLRLEAQLLQAQKMEALGTLAGGIAHDFNNILTAITGNVELARLDAGADSPLQRNLAETAKAAQRAADLVRQILTFSRRQPLERVVVNLRELVLEAVKLLRSTLPAGIELVTTLAPDSPNVSADRTQLHQVLMNLVVNAAQAIGKQPGRIEISLAGVVVSDDPSAPALPPGGYARLSVTDNGPGMDAATRQRVFDPFFTTKPVGEGTGLGLAVVDGIVKRLGGAINVYSEPGRGCVFQLYFPATATDAVVAVEPSSFGSLAGSNQRILYLDDDVALVLIGQAMLERLGYRVDGHTDAGQALAAFEADPTGFDALISDFNMPGTSGLELAAKVLQQRPDLPVALASGLVTDELLTQAQAVGVREVIYKPHSLGDLAAALHRMLSGNI